MRDCFYVFYISTDPYQPDNPRPNYERNCGTEDAAKARVRTLKSRYGKAFFMKNEKPEEFWY